MAVKLRLRRMGKKRQPIYKVVAADERSPRDGKFIEAIGLYNPKTEPSTIEINEDRALYWLNTGAQPTTTVKNLLSKEGILYKNALMKKGLSDDQISAALDEWKQKKMSKVELERAKAEKEKAEKAKAKEEEEKAKQEEEAKAEAEAAAAKEEEKAEDASEEDKAEEKKEE